MGSVNTLCLEKEGTLTMSDQMCVKKSQIYGDAFKNVEKNGDYRPAQNLIIECIYFSCTAWIEQDKKRTMTKGNLTE
jgi:magnesium-transporting ATPase (P-type)